MLQGIILFFFFLHEIHTMVVQLGKPSSCSHSYVRTQLYALQTPSLFGPKTMF